MSKQRSGVPKGQPLDPTVQAELQEIVIRLGESRAVRELKLHKGTLMRALASFPLYPSTRIAIEHEIAAWKAAHHDA